MVMTRGPSVSMLLPRLKPSSECVDLRLRRHPGLPRPYRGALRLNRRECLFMALRVGLA
jgi:hypothetical protein